MGNIQYNRRVNKSYINENHLIYLLIYSMEQSPS